jgi:hypothetical protein
LELLFEDEREDEEGVLDLLEFSWRLRLIVEKCKRALQFSVVVGE